MNIPQRIEAGDTLKVSVPAPFVPPAYSDDSTSVAYALTLTPETGAPITAVGVYADNAIRFELLPPAGIYKWALSATYSYRAGADARWTWERGTLLVAGSGQTHAERVVALLESTIERKLSGRGDVMSYSMGDRNIATMSLQALRAELARYHATVALERRARAEGSLGVGYRRAT